MRRPHVLLAAATVSTLSLLGCTGAITDSGTGAGEPHDGIGTNDPNANPDEPIAPQDPVYREQHPRIYLERNLERLQTSLAAQSPAAMRFVESVDAQVNGGRMYNFRAWYAALVGQLTGEAKYCTYAINQVETYVKAEEALIASGQKPDVSHDSYLEIGEHIGDVMFTYDWCNAQVTSSQKTRWLSYANQAIWNVWNPQQATWGGKSFPWSGWSINNPSNNYYYSFVRATMLFGLAARGEHPEADKWLTFFRETKFQGQMVPTFAAQLEGGGSREGTGYGTAMQNLWWIYDLWQGSTGEDLARQTTHARASLLWMMHAIVPTRDRVAPIGDHTRDTSAALFDYHRNYLQELTFLFRDDELSKRAKYLVDNSSVPNMDQSFMAVFDYLYEAPEMESAPMDSMKTAFYGPGTGEFFARSSWGEDATWVNLIAGPYTESHAHRDQGSFMLFKNDWLAYDPVVESHTGIRQEEELHNLVRITQNGQTVKQVVNTESKVTALSQGDGYVHIAVDVTAAYKGHAAVQKVEREMVFLQPNVLVIFDRVTTAAGTQQIWQMSSPTRPTVSGTRATVNTDSSDLVVDRLLPAAATTSVKDWASDSEFSGGHRLDTTVAGGAQQFLHVLSIDGAATSVTRSDAAGRVGAQIQLNDGRTATIRFGAAAVDGTIEISGGVNVAVGPGVSL